MEALSSFNENSHSKRLSLPVIFLGVYIFLLPLDFLPTEYGSIARILGILPIGLTIAFYFRQLKINMVCAGLMTLYVFLNIMSIYYCEKPEEAMELSLTLLSNFLMILICSAMDVNENEKKFLIKSMVYSGWFMFALVLFFGRFSGGRLIVVINGKGQDPNYFCGYLMFVTLYYLDKIIKKERIILSLFFVAVLLMVVLLTGSRGGLIAVALAGFLLVLFNGSGKRFFYKLLLTALLLFLAYLLIVYFLPDEIRMRFNPEYTQNDAGAGRFDIWRDLIDTYINRYNTFEKWFGGGAGNVTYISSYGKVAHNLWLENLVEVGRVGLFLLACIYFFFFRKAWMLKDKLFLFVFIGYGIMTLSMSLNAYKPIFALFILINLFSNDRCSQDRGKDCAQLEDKGVI